jgi:type IV fimbrial biogenesis protein FimT
MSVLLAIAGSQMGAWSGSNRLADHAGILLADLQLARSEAIKRNARVALCKSPDGAACRNTGGWEQGLIVFHDANNNGRREAAEEVLHRTAPLQGDFLMRGNQPVRDYVSYGATGVTRLEAGGFQAGTITVCRRSAGATETRQVIVNAAGRPRVQKAAADSCG